MLVEEFLLHYWLEAFFGGALALLGLVNRRISRRMRELDSVRMGVQALLRDRIIQSYNHYIDKGFCPIYALESMQAMYAEYHNLGGNGTITELMEKIRELPTEKKREQHEKSTQKS